MNEKLVVSEGYTLAPKAKRLIERTLASGSTVNIVALSCPDYASSGDVYTFEGTLGEGVPLLTKLHCDAIEQSIEHIDPGQINIELLIADIESENTSLVNLYTGGDYDEYKRRCDVSMLMVHGYLNDRFPEIKTVSSSFMRLCDTDGTFLDYRNKYFGILMQRFNIDHGFRLQVENNVRNKHTGMHTTSCQYPIP